MPEKLRSVSPRILGTTFYSVLERIRGLQEESYLHIKDNDIEIPHSTGISRGVEGL